MSFPEGQDNRFATAHGAGEADGATASRRAGERAARNTVVQAVGEILGSLASAALFAAMTRTLGQSEVGVYVAATAYVAITMVPVDLGLDRYVLREVARRPEAVRRLFWNSLALKLVLALPVFGIAYGVIHALPFTPQTRTTAYLLSAGLLFHSMTLMVRSVFLAFERSRPVAVVIFVQRLLAATLGFGVLLAGGGVQEIVVTYGVSTLTAFVLATVLLFRTIGTIPLAVGREVQADLFMRGLPFVSQDALTVLLFRLDAVLLAALGTEAAVGRYGAAYLLIDSMWFVTVSLLGAFAAMYAYLGPDTQPTVRTVYQSSLKSSLVLLVPVAVTFGVLATPLCRLFFGEAFAAAGEPLRLLAPVLVLLSLAGLSSSLVISRRSPLVMVLITAIAVALNVALNVALIPRWADVGAAAAMLATAAVFAALGAGVGSATVGRPSLRVAAVGPMLAGTAMAAVMVPLSQWLAVALIAGGTVYVVTLGVVERALNRSDFDFARDLAARRLPGGLRRAFGLGS
jgi:O-antigen/teichoic acid export membrane protein